MPKIDTTTMLSVALGGIIAAVLMKAVGNAIVSRTPTILT